jgi:tetratricopeptide (TPR) repeat protein
LAIGALVGLLGVTVAAVRFWQQAGPVVPPDPAAFTYPTLPTKMDPAPPATKRPGFDAYAEGLRLLIAKDPANAAVAFSEALGTAPENAMYQRAYGEALFLSGDREAGLYALAEAARLQPAAYRLDYARFLDVAGRYTEAVQEVDAVLVERPNDADALQWAGRIHGDGNDFRGAISILKRAAELRPVDPSLLTSLGSASERGGDWNGAALTYGRMVRLDPGNDLARGRWAEVLVKQGKVEQAVDVYRQGLQRDPRSAVLLRGLGSVLEDAGRPAEAAAAYREYARLVPRAPDAPALIARADRLLSVAGS